MYSTFRCMHHLHLHVQRPPTATPKLPALTQPTAARPGLNHPHLETIRSAQVPSFPTTISIRTKQEEAAVFPSFFTRPLTTFEE